MTPPAQQPQSGGNDLSGSAAGSSSPPGEAGAARWLKPVGLGLLLLYAFILSVITLDRLFEFGWFPSQLERRVREQIHRLASPDETERQAAKEKLRLMEAFVVIPELIRALNDSSVEQRKAQEEILKELTWNRLHGQLMGYTAEGSTEERRRAQRKLWDWWKTAEEDY